MIIVKHKRTLKIDLSFILFRMKNAININVNIFLLVSLICSKSLDVSLCLRDTVYACLYAPVRVCVCMCEGFQVRATSSHLTSSKSD